MPAASGRVKVGKRRGKMQATVLIGKARRASRAMKTPEQKARRLERKLLPEAQGGRSEFVAVDVANYSETDQRHMVRSEERQTLRRKTKIEKLRTAGILSAQDAEACEWYHDRHALGFDTLGITADYGRAGRGSGTADHLARYKAQQDARADYEFARAGIPAPLVGLFENTVLRHRPLGKLSLSFKLAVKKLRERIDHLLPGA